MDKFIGEAFIKDGHVIASPVIIKKQEKIPEELEEFRDMVKCAIYSSTFSCRIIGKDSFTGKQYSEEDVIYSYIQGIRLIYYIPGGLLTYYKNNKFMMDCANIEFMDMYSAIPYTNTTIGTKILVKRSSGFIQYGSILRGYSFRISINKKIQNLDFQMAVCFNLDESNNKEYDDMTIYDNFKTIYLSDYLEVNPNIEPLVFTFNKLQNISHENQVYKDSIEMYNQILSNFIIKVNEVIKINEYPVKIILK